MVRTNRKNGSIQRIYLLTGLESSGEINKKISQETGENFQSENRVNAIVVSLQ
jgi:hypothetical protein